MSVRRYLAWLAAVVALGAIGWAAACASSTHDEIAAPSSPPHLAISVTQAVTYPSVSDLPVGGTPRLPFREYRLPGVWSVGDYDDQVAVLLHGRSSSTYKRMYLMAVRGGRCRCVQRDAVNAAAGYWISQCRATSHWVAWEEVSPGDDLVSTVTWRLYAALVRAASLSIGRARLIDSAPTSQASRPLFDVTGDRLVWMTGGAREPRWPSVVYSCDLSSRAGPRVVTRSHVPFLSLVAHNGLVTVAARCKPQALDVRLLSARLSDGRALPSLDLGNRQDLVQFPAARAGWLAWSLFRDESQSNESLFVRAPSGLVHLVGEEGAGRPVFTAQCLFYTDNARGAGGVAVTRVCGLDLASMTRFVLQQSEAEAQGTCLTALGAPAAERTLVTQMVRFDEKWSTLRVYRLP